MLTAQQTKHVSTRNARILVQDYVVSTQNAMSETMSRFVSVYLVILGIHLASVTDHQVSLEILVSLLVFTHQFLATPRPIEVIQPCNPSPCGTNAECTERGNAASCRCILDYIGNPYVECKPECTVNSECPRDKACINNHCEDPCPGVCGQHATCRVANHIPQCTCDPGYSGNPFVSCTRVTTCKLLVN